MSGVDRFPGRDPQCICPEVTFTSGPTAEQRAACRAMSGGRLHAVLTAADMEAISRQFFADRGLIHPADSVAAAEAEIREMNS